MSAEPATARISTVSPCAGRPSTLVLPQLANTAKPSYPSNFCGPRLTDDELRGQASRYSLKILHTNPLGVFLGSAVPPRRLERVIFADHLLRDSPSGTDSRTYKASGIFSP